MRILVITDKLYPDEYGGSCAVAYELIKEWQIDNKVDIFTCYPEKMENDKLFSGNVFRLFNKRKLLYSSVKLRHILNSNRYDVMVIHSAFSWLLYYLATMGLKNNVKIYNVFHGPWHKEAWFKYSGTKERFKRLVFVPIMKMIEKIYVAKNDNFIFLSKYMYDELEKINGNIRYKSISIIHGGVDLEKFKRTGSIEEVRNRIGIPKNKTVLFTLRRLDKRMGIDRLIKAVKEMNDDERNKYIVLIGGKGGYKQELEKIAEPIKDNVIFLGFVSDKMVVEYFSAADIFVVPTIDLEGFGLVNLESLAVGTTVLATPQGGMVELANSFKNMHLTKSSEVEDILNGIRECIENKKNNVLEKDNMSGYSWSAVAKQYIRLFDDK